MSRRKGVSYLSMTMKECRKMGYLVEKTEYWNPFSRTRHDIFGFMDALAMNNEKETVALQVCNPSSFAEHKREILSLPAALRWLQCGNKIEIWTCRKLKVKRGGKATRWRFRVERLSDFNLAEVKI